MSQARVIEYATTVSAYLSTLEGRREMNRLTYRFNLTYPQALAQKVAVICGIERIEDLTAVTDEVLLKVLAA